MGNTMAKNAKKVRVIYDDERRRKELLGMLGKKKKRKEKALKAREQLAKDEKREFKAERRRLRKTRVDLMKKNFEQAEAVYKSIKKMDVKKEVKQEMQTANDEQVDVTIQFL